MKFRLSAQCFLAVFTLALFTVGVVRAEGGEHAVDPAQAEQAKAEKAKAEQALAEQVKAGQSKSAPCVACHGIDGNSANPEWPSIAAQHPSYIIKQLKAFKSGARQNGLMSPQAQPLSDQDIEDLAAFYSSQTARGLEANKNGVKDGQKLYRGGNPASGVAACIACHGPNGRGNLAAAYPSIRGQQAKYIEAQLMAYKAEQRGTDANKMMRDIASHLTVEEIAAVATYIQGLR